VKCIRYILDLWGHKIKFAKIIAGWEGIAINGTSDFFSGILDSRLKLMVILLMEVAVV